MALFLPNWWRRLTTRLATGNVWNKELATKFKQTFLERGGSEEPMVLYEQFAGRKPDNNAFLRGRGLKYEGLPPLL